MGSIFHAGTANSPHQPLRLLFKIFILVSVVTIDEFEQLADNIQLQTLIQLYEQQNGLTGMYVMFRIVLKKGLILFILWILSIDV